MRVLQKMKSGSNNACKVKHDVHNEMPQKFSSRQLRANCSSEHTSQNTHVAHICESRHAGHVSNTDQHSNKSYISEGTRIKSTGPVQLVSDRHRHPYSSFSTFAFMSVMGVLGRELICMLQAMLP